ncbi:MAG: hypothetical protein KatS3mg102_0195 [Planctomycetota bacterium]|nr:MAG: hypothetical protein KatS3mg102_0195 [Planctomycetota bacterium]
MIRREAGEDWLLIAQPEHARMAGVLAQAWALGGERPSPGAIYAAAHHDDGWQLWEQRPRVEPASGAPCNFTEISAAEHLEIWRRGPELVAAHDSYAGLLVSHHGSFLTELRLRSVRLRPGEAEPQRAYLEQAAAWRERVVRGQQLDRERLAREVLLLRLLDYLSLLLCWYPAQDRRIEQHEPGAPPLVLELRARGPCAVAVDPWPFAPELAALEAPVSARRLPRRRYDDASLRAALASAPVETIPIRYERA